jgi:hypothetical protein
MIIWATAKLPITKLSRNYAAVLLPKATLSVCDKNWADMLLKAAGHVSEGGSGRQSSKGAIIKRGEIGGVDNAIAPHQFAASMANLILVLLSNCWGRSIIPAMAHNA